MRAILEKLYELRAESDKRGQELKKLLQSDNLGSPQYMTSDLIKAQAVELERYDKALRELLDVAWEEVE